VSEEDKERQCQAPVNSYGPRHQAAICRGYFFYFGGRSEEKVMNGISLFNRQPLFLFQIKNQRSRKSRLL
jgi:hypothetical protein